MRTPSASARTNAAWLSDLHSSGPAREDALADLRDIILAGLPYALAEWLPRDDPQLEALAQEVTQETLLKVLDHLESFEGRSQFATWAQKIAVRVALTELRRRRWKDVPLEGLLDNEVGEAAPEVMADPTPGPELVAERADLLARLNRLLMEELTEKQRRAMMAVVMQSMPLEEVARRMGMERNALYKLLHDARLRLKRRLAREGLTPGEVLAVFEKG